MKDLSENYPDVDFVYPMHLNPNVRKPIREMSGEDLTKNANFFFIEPLQYLEFVYLLEKTSIVLTDSSGIQVRFRDVRHYRAPCLVILWRAKR